MARLQIPHVPGPTSVRGFGVAENDRYAQDGGPAPFKLPFAPPDTTGYTVRTITLDEADVTTTSELYINLDDATDYVILSPYAIRRSVQLIGGRNIVWIGCHIRIDHKGWFPGGRYQRALLIKDGPAASPRIVHIEGIWTDGSDKGEGIDTECPKAIVRLGYWRDQRDAIRSSDAFGANPVTANDGTGPYAGVEHSHPDGMQDYGAHAGMQIERASIYHSSTGLRWNETTNTALGGATNRARNINIEADPKYATEEGPYTDATDYHDPKFVRYNFEPGTTGGWNGASGAVTSVESVAPLNGAFSLKISESGTDTEHIAGVIFGSPTDRSAGTGLSFLAKLASGGGHWPMVRMDVTTDSAATLSGLEGWHIGQSFHVTPTTRLCICNFPKNILVTLRKIRIVFITDGASGTHEILIDDISEASGQITNTFTGPPVNYAGKWAIYHNEANAGRLLLDNVYAQHNNWGLWISNRDGTGTGQNYTLRELDVAATQSSGVLTYVDDPPPGNATHEDQFFPSPPVTGTDGIGDYVSWNDTVGSEIRDWSGTAPARVYAGRPPGGDFAPLGVPGVNYVSAGYFAGFEDLLSNGAGSGTLDLTVPAAGADLGTLSSSGQASASLALTAPTQVPLAASAGVATTSLALTAPTRIPLGASAGVASGTLALTAPTRIPLDASAGVASATLALTAPTRIPLGASGGVATTSLALTAPTRLALGASSGTSTATMALTAPALLPLGAALGVGSATLALRAPTRLLLDPSAGVASATLALTLPATGTSPVTHPPTGGSPLQGGNTGGDPNASLTGGTMTDYFTGGDPIIDSIGGESD